MGVAGVYTMQQEYAQKILPLEWGPLSTFNTLLDLSRQIIYRPHRERKKEWERGNCVCWAGRRVEPMRTTTKNVFFFTIFLPLFTHSKNAQTVRKQCKIKRQLGRDRLYHGREGRRLEGWHNTAARLANYWWEGVILSMPPAWRTTPLSRPDKRTQNTVMSYVTQERHGLVL